MTALAFQQKYKTQTNLTSKTDLLEKAFYNTKNADRLISTYQNALQYLTTLSVEQQEALNISTKTVYWLQKIKVKFIEDLAPNATMRMYNREKNVLTIQSSKKFRNTSDQALNWETLRWFKDIDQLVKGKQSVMHTSPSDLDDKLLHQASENELPLVGLFSSPLQAFLPKLVGREVSNDFSRRMIMPAVSAIAHRAIAHRCDKFASNVTGMTFKEYVDDVKKVMRYEPVDQTLYNFFYNATPSDVKRMEKTEETVAGSADFRAVHNIPQCKP